MISILIKLYFNIYREAACCHWKEQTFWKSEILRSESWLCHSLPSYVTLCKLFTVFWLQHLDLSMGLLSIQGFGEALTKPILSRLSGSLREQVLSLLESQRSLTVSVFKELPLNWRRRDHTKRWGEGNIVLIHGENHGQTGGLKCFAFVGGWCRVDTNAYLAHILILWPFMHLYFSSFLINVFRMKVVSIKTTSFLTSLDNIIKYDLFWRVVWELSSEARQLTHPFSPGEV